MYYHFQDSLPEAPKTHYKTTNCSKFTNQALGLTDINWKKVYMLPRQATIGSSVRSFQYKILNNILYLNEKLFKFKIVDSPLRTLCKTENESMLHLFCECAVTSNLLEQFKLWVSDIFLVR